ncbi:MAG: D-alanine--D-alanine ligase [Desulfobacterales bacterium]
MRVSVVYNAVTDDGRADEQDVLVQVDAVRKALRALGHAAYTLPAGLELGQLHDRLEAQRPDLVFNLVESLAGHGRLIHLVPSLLDAMGLHYTGAPAEAIWLTSHKVLAKERMLAAGLPTPAWAGPCPQELPSPPSLRPADRGRRWIIKSLWEHASVGLEADNIVEDTGDQSLEQAMQVRAPLLGGVCFAEVFVEGREFNLSVLAGPQGPQVLPPAEIDFKGLGAGQPRIVGYRAKWDVNSAEYHHTPRSFEFGAEDRPLLDELQALALQSWQLFGLRGYARVDFRVDEKGQPWILEINANPCLSPDAGFAAALDRAGIDFTLAVKWIVADSLDPPQYPRVRSADPH